MHYSTFFPKLLLPIYNFYYKHFFIKKSKANFIAIGLIGPGIFNNEPIYKNIKELKRDMKFLKSCNAKELIFFNLESLSHKSKDWLEIALA
jgi:hypothetical protein